MSYRNDFIKSSIHLIVANLDTSVSGSYINFATPETSGTYPQIAQNHWPMKIEDNVFLSVFDKITSSVVNAFPRVTANHWQVIQRGVTKLPFHDLEKLSSVWCSKHYLLSSADFFLLIQSFKNRIFQITNAYK
jgi:hypothetical protein